MRAQLATPNEHFVTRDRYNELFTIHGTTMVFLVVVPILAGLGNYLVPLMIGARDMAFPRLNAFSYWMFLLGGIVLYSSFFADGGPAKTGWTAYVPLSENQYSAGPRPGPLDPLATPARGLLARGRDQLHRDDPQHARARDDLDAHAALRLVDRGLRLPARRHPAGDRRRPAAAPARPPGRHALLPPERRRQRAPLPAHLLVLRAPGGVRPDHPGDGDHLRDHPRLRPQADLRLQGGRVLVGRHRVHLDDRLGAPHVHGRPRAGSSRASS